LVTIGGGGGIRRMGQIVKNATFPDRIKKRYLERKKKKKKHLFSSEEDELNT